MRERIALISGNEGHVRNKLRPGAVYRANFAAKLRQDRPKTAPESPQYFNERTLDCSVAVFGAHLWERRSVEIFGFGQIDQRIHVFLTSLHPAEMAE
jgi:hypothetical protein